MLNEKNKGISLIVLVITIIVMAILVGAIALSYVTNNPKNSAKEATFKQNIKSYQSELSLFLSQQLFQDHNYSPENLDTESDGKLYNTLNGTKTEVEGGIVAVIKSMANRTDESKFQIQKGNLVYVGSDDNEKIWATAAGANPSQSSGGEEEPGNTVPTDWASSVTSLTSEKVPIPKGFYYVGGDLSKGVVISDNSADENAEVDKSDEDIQSNIQNLSGNQFVWVPIKSSKNIKTSYPVINFNTFQQSNTMVIYGSNYTLKNYNDSSSTKAVEEPEYNAMCDSITKYGGFYIGRYELTSSGESKAGQPTNSAYWDSLVYVARALYGTSNNSTGVMSHLVYGVEWDATMDYMSDVNNPNVSSAKYIIDSTGMKSDIYDEISNLVNQGYLSSNLTFDNYNPSSGEFDYKTYFRNDYYYVKYHYFAPEYAYFITKYYITYYYDSEGNLVNGWDEWSYSDRQEVSSSDPYDETEEIQVPEGEPYDNCRETGNYIEVGPYDSYQYFEEETVDENQSYDSINTTGGTTEITYDEYSQHQSMPNFNNYYYESYNSYYMNPVVTGLHRVKNIYDMAGNSWEHTMEYNAQTKNRVIRGGGYEYPLYGVYPLNMYYLTYNADDFYTAKGVSKRLLATAPSISLQAGGRASLYIK